MGRPLKRIDRVAHQDRASRDQGHSDRAPHVLEEVMADVMFEAPELQQRVLTINEDFVLSRLKEIR